MPVRLLSYFAYSGCRGLTANRRGLFHRARFATVFPTDVLYGPSSFASVESVFAIFGYALGRLLLSMRCFFESVVGNLYVFLFFPGEQIVDGVRVDAAFFELFFHSIDSFTLSLESFIRRATFLPYFHCARLSLSQFIFHLYSCLSLSLSLSLSLLGDFSLVFLSGLTQFFFFFVNNRLRWRCENFTRANRPCFFSTRLRLGLDSFLLCFFEVIT